MFMPTLGLSWGNGERARDGGGDFLPQIAFNYVACCSRFYGPLLTCLQFQCCCSCCLWHVRVDDLFVEWSTYLSVATCNLQLRLPSRHLLQLAFAKCHALCTATPHLPITRSRPSHFVFMTLILIIDSGIKMFHYARRAAQEPAANCLRKCATSSPLRSADCSPQSPSLGHLVSCVRICCL